MFKIIKKGSGNFWHNFNNGSKEVNLSDWEIVLDSVNQTVSLQMLNGANVPINSVFISDILIIDETDGSVEETFVSVEALRIRLVELNYTPYIVLNGFVPEAPIDGLTYGRKDAEWVEVSGGGDFIPLSGTEVDKPITGDLSYGQLDGVARKITFKDSNDYNFDLTFGNDASELGEPKVIGFYATDDTVFGKIGLDPSFQPFFQIGNGTYFGKFTFNAVQTIHFISDNPLCAGIEGNLDYSANYTPTCFVQKVYVDTKLKQTEATTGAVISFANPQVYNTYTTPTSSNITNDLTGAKIGIVQKIYSNKATEPTYPAGWVKLSGTYTNSVTNIIYAEWCEGSRVEYWIVEA